MGRGKVMGMSTRVVLLRDDQHPKYQAYKSIWELCIGNGIAPPDEVDELFPSGPASFLEVKFYKAREWRGDMMYGVEVDVADIPKEVKTIRFYNSW